MNKVKFYKNRYCLAFYDKTDEHLLYLFDNANEILKFQGKEVNNQNQKVVLIEIYRALRSVEHFCTFLTGKVMRLYLIDMYDEIEEVNNDNN